MHESQFLRFSLAPCRCGKVVRGVPPSQAVLGWSAFHGFEASLDAGRVRVMHQACLPAQSGILGLLDVAYVVQASPPAQSSAAWIRAAYPDLIDQLVAEHVSGKETEGHA